MLYVFLCSCTTHSMPCSLLDDATSKDLTKIWGEGENDWSVFSIFYLIISCFTYDQHFVGRCHFKDFWSEGSRKRGREWGFHLLCQVRSESMSKRGEVDILMTTKWILGLLEKYLLKLGNWVIEFWFELEKYFSLHKKKFRVFLCCLSVSPEYFGLDAFESSQRHERPHQSLFNISDRFCLTKPFYS